MSKITGLRMTVLCGLAVAAGATVSITPFEVPQRHLLPIQTFPVQIGSWQNMGEHPVDPTVQEHLPTARILDRTYRNAKTGKLVDVMLLTATAVDDIHKPTSCLPAQGWQLGQPEYRTVGSQSMTVLTAGNDANQRIQVAYWLTGYYLPRASHGPVIDGLLQIRNRSVGPDKAMSLFVRVIADESDSADLADFVTSALPAVDRLTAPYDTSTSPNAPGLARN